VRLYFSLLRDYLGRALLVALIVLVVSTSGYILLAQYSWFDALFMTVITLGTVGYGEVQPLNQAGRIWTMLVIVFGYGVLVNITARFTSLLLSGAFAENRDNSRRKKLIANCNNHLVVVGYGRVGRSTVESTISAQKTCVVIEANEDLRREIEATGAIPIIGDARDLEVLSQAAIDRAQCLVTAMSDADNLVVVATVRLTYPNIRIVSRVNEVQWSDRLRRAGADELIPIYLSAGRHLANAAFHTGIIGVLDDGSDALTEQFLVRSYAPVCGRTIHDLMQENPSVIVLGIRRDSKLSRWHEIDTPLQADDVLFAIGPGGAMEKFSEIFDSEPNL
jgi:voltage-gated potassium channel